MPLLTQIIDICRLRGAPQDLPYSTNLLIATAVASVCVHLATALFAGLPVGDVLGGALLSLGFTLIALHLMLSLRNLHNRFVQTASALLLCALVFTILCLPIVLSFPAEVLNGSQQLKPDQLTPLHGLLVLMSLPLLIWKIIVDAHILRHSLDLPFLSGLLIAVLWLIAQMALSAVVGGVTGSSPA